MRVWERIKIHSDRVYHTLYYWLNLHTYLNNLHSTKSTETFKPVRKHVHKNLHNICVGINERSYICKSFVVKVHYKFHFNFKEHFSANLDNNILVNLLK